MFPFVFKLTDKKLLFIGGGNVVERKVFSILSVSKPKITILSDKITRKLNMLLSENKIFWIEKTFDFDKDLKDFDFVLICTDDKNVNLRAANFFKELKIPVSVCDNKEVSDFFMPAIIDEDDYLISISTKGKSPGKSKKLKEKIKELLKML